MSNLLYFEAQTGIIKYIDWESNFYHYCLDVRYSWSITTETWLRKHIKKATLMGDYLTYDKSFYDQLERFEERTKKLIKHVRRFGLI